MAVSGEYFINLAQTSNKNQVYIKMLFPDKNIREFNIVFWIMIPLISCCTRKKVNDQFVIVEKYNEKYIEDSIKYAPYDYYVGNNIILLEKSEKIFFHDNVNYCGTGWKVNNPPARINFDRYPLLQFKSAGEFSNFIKKYTSTPRLVMFASDSDTIRSNNYFNLIDTFKNLEKTYVVARRKLTEDELVAIFNSKFLAIDMNENCDLEDLSKLKYNLRTTKNYEEYINRFFELSEKHCQYYLDYELLYEELTYLLIIKDPTKFLNQCDKINEKVKRNISLALKGSLLVEDSVIQQAYNSLQLMENNSQKWVLENIEARMKYL